jgi:hypothetical protein
LLDQDDCCYELIEVSTVPYQADRQRPPSDSPNIRYSVGMGYHTGYYGRSPYGYYDRPNVIVVPDDRPVARPLSEPGMDFGMPEAGFDDFGGFDF